MTAAASINVVEARGNWLAYAAAGPADAEVVMLGHALGTDHRMWQHQIDSLSRRYRVIAPHFRGHGQTPAGALPCDFRMLAGDCAALADALGISRLHYVGLSLGGVVGMELALGWPGLVKRLVLSNTRCAVDAAFQASCTRRTEAARAHGMKALTASTVARWFPPGFLQSEPRTADLMHEMFEATSPEIYIALCESLGKLSICGQIGRIRCPVLIIGGALDQTTGPDVIEDIGRAIQGAQVTILENCAHFPNIEAQASFNDLIEAFLGDR